MRIEKPLLDQHITIVYVIGPTPEGPVKIGRTNNLSERIQGLQTGCWELLLPWAVRVAIRRGPSSAKKSRLRTYSAGATSLELKTHSVLRDLGFGLIGEWFDLDVKSALLVMEKTARAEGLGYAGPEDVAGFDMLARADRSAAREQKRLSRELLQINKFSQDYHTFFSKLADVDG